MHKIINSIVISLLLSSNLFAESYIATRQELWFSDSSYYKTSHHVKIGKKIKMENYSLFGELGVGEDINEGTQWDLDNHLTILDLASLRLSLML